MEPNQGGEVIVPIPEKVVEAKDLRDWDRIVVVREHTRRGMGIYAACEAAGVPPTTYYRALTNPYVQQQILLEVRSLSEATRTVLERDWLPILVAQARIAQDTHHRETVSAARFVRDVLNDAQKVAEASGDPRAKDATSLFVEQFMSAPGKRTYRAKRRTKRGDTSIEEEIEVEGEPLSDGNDVIDVTPSS
jgi:hypothetical protein